MKISRNQHDIPRVRVRETRLPTEQLPERVQLADEELPAGTQDACGLAEHMLKVFDVFEDERAHDRIERLACHVPAGS